MLRSASQSSIWGYQNGWMGLELFSPEHTKKAAFLRKVGQYRNIAKKFLTSRKGWPSPFGELVDLVEPIKPVETITERWPDHGNNPRDATLASIQGTIWKADDGTLGIFLVNYLEKDNKIEFAIDPAKPALSRAEGYGVGADAAGFSITRISPEAGHSLEAAPGGPIRRTETLGPWEIRVLQISPSQRS